VAARTSGKATSSVDRRSDERRGLAALEALNFFMADMQAGIGPFLGVFLQMRGWSAGSIGLVMTMGGIAGTVMTAPAGALIDASPRKRMWVILSGVASLLGSIVIYVSHDFWLIAGSQIFTAIAGAAIGPAVIGITLGVVRRGGFNRQNGRNQAFNHAGNMVGAGLSGYLGWHFGFLAVFGLAALFGILSITAVLLIPRRIIDNRAARGLEKRRVMKKKPGATRDDDQEEQDEDEPLQGFRVLVQSKPMLVLAAALALFHLGNGAMLPLYGLAVVGAHLGDPASFVAMTIVVAQGVMILSSLAAIRLIERYGYWLVVLAIFLVLPVRGVVAASLIRAWGVWPVQILDGIGAGLMSVAIPGLVAHMLRGTGRMNLGQGAMMTVQSLGASLSPALGGLIADHLGYPPTFLILGAFSLASLLLWLVFAPLLKQAAAGYRS
jgi:MFS family permease